MSVIPVFTGYFSFYCGFYSLSVDSVVHFSRILCTEDMCSYTNQSMNSLKLQNKLLCPYRNICLFKFVGTF